MSTTNLVIYVFLGLIVLIIVALIYRRIPKKLKVDDFTHEWRELQVLCKDKTTWPEAVTRADALLSKALKRRRFKGKSRGERMMSAQRIFTNNDDLWFAHNFYKKIVANPAMKLKDIDVKEALIGFRQALKDLGAFDDGKDLTDKTKPDEAQK